MNPAPRRRHARIVGQLIALLDARGNDLGLEAVDGINIGVAHNFRVPDGALLQPGPDEVYLATAELIFEVRSPGDETYEKFPHYAAHGVGEILVVHSDEHAIEIHVLGGADYRRADASPLLGASQADLEAAISWP
jgi:Uma2 family endonuclease